MRTKLQPMAKPRFKSLDMVREHFARLPMGYYSVKEVRKILKDLGIKSPESWISMNRKKMSGFLERVNGYNNF